MTYIIAIGGPSASGTTTFSKQLRGIMQQSGKSTQVLGSDQYYPEYHKWGLTQTEIDQLGLGFRPTEQRAAELRFPALGPSDLPYSFDHPLMCDWTQYRIDVQDIKDGISIMRFPYDFSTHSYDESQPVNVTPGGLDVLILEGLHVLNKQIAQIPFDFGIYISTPFETCDARRIQRDQQERGRSKESILTQLQSTVWPAREVFVEPTRVDADIELNYCNNDGKLQTRVAQVLDALNQRLYPPEELSFDLAEKTVVSETPSF